MKKIILWSISFLFLVIIFISSYLSLVGYETNKFNSLLENKITSNVSNTEINLNKIKIKIDVQNMSFFITTLKPNIKYYEKNVNISKIDAYINLKSLLIGKPKIDKINIESNEIEVDEIKDIVKYQKPSNLKKFFLNEISKGKIIFKLDLKLKNNEIVNYEINGIVKNFFARVQNIDIKKTSFIYSIKENSGEIDKIRGYISGFQINSGSVKFDNSKTLNVKGNILSDLNLSKININKIINKEVLKNFENLQIVGKIRSAFEIKFDETLKLIDYQAEVSGNIKKSDITFKKSKKYLFLKNEINNFGLEKTEFKINFNKDQKNSINIEGLYKANDNLLQKFVFKNSYISSLQKLSINADFADEVDIPFINFSLKDKIVNINTELEVNKDKINLKKFNLTEGKNKIEIKNLVLKDKKLLKFDNIFVKTFTNGKYNNDFKVYFEKKIKVEGTKYDASNLTKLLEQNNKSIFLQNINKEIFINFSEVSTNASDLISNFNLIGNIEKGKLNKIVSKGEFKDGKYLDISLRVDKTSKKKILEIYSDLSRPLLSNYKFFDGVSGGQVLIFSSYDTIKSDTNLTIENFKVKGAPGLVKLLSLADFGGMVDALSGDGLSFEKLEMTFEKNNQLLSLKELYAIGPSISILMEGYVETKSGLVSLRGTMVPAKTLNKFLSKLPVVGNILIPKEIGEGLFGISFKMKGAPGKIKTTVNPIKTLTPRFIQKALKKPK